MHERPCAVDPVSWDLDAGVGTPHIPVAQMIRACLTQCPRLERCRAETADDLVFGVVAGEYRPWPSDARLATLQRSRVLRRLVARIMTKVAALEPETPLSIVQLAADLDASRTSVRAALRWLAAEDVLILPTTRTGPYRVSPPRKENAA